MRRGEISFEDQVRDLMLKHSITYHEAEKLIKSNQKSLGNFGIR